MKLASLSQFCFPCEPEKIFRLQFISVFSLPKGKILRTKYYFQTHLKYYFEIERNDSGTILGPEEFILGLEESIFEMEESIFGLGESIFGLEESILGPFRDQKSPFWEKKSPF